MRLRRALRNTSLVVGSLITLAIVLAAVLAPVLATHGVEQMDMRQRFAGPSRIALARHRQFRRATCGHG